MAKSSDEWYCELRSIQNSNILRNEIKALNQTINLLQKGLTELGEVCLSELCINKEKEIVNLKLETKPQKN